MRLGGNRNLVCDEKNDCNQCSALVDKISINPIRKQRNSVFRANYGTYADIISILWQLESIYESCCESILVATLNFVDGVAAVHSPFYVLLRCVRYSLFDTELRAFSEVTMFKRTFCVSETAFDFVIFYFGNSFLSLIATEKAFLSDVQPHG